MTIALITGAGGFIARALARRLAGENGLTVWGTGRRDRPVDPAGLHHYRAADVADARAVSDLVAAVKPDWVFHLAGAASAPMDEIYRTNALGCVYLLEALHRHAEKARVVLVGSAAEYGAVNASELPIRETLHCRPVGFYGASKHVATVAGIGYARRYGMKIAVARPFNAVGPGIPPVYVVGAILARLKESLAAGGEPVLKIGNLEGVRDFVSVKDVVEGLVGMIRSEPWGEIFNLCTGRPVAIGTVVELLLARQPRPVRVETDPSLTRPSEAPVSYGSWEKAARAFGYRPTVSLEDTLAETWAAAMKDKA